MIEAITRLFPVWAILSSVIAWRYPAALSQLRPAIVPLLGVVMFGMGITLTARSFLEVFERPAVIVLGTFMQYLLMPFFAWSTSLLFGFPPQITAGLVLVGSCPGGTASNVICYLARGNVALSITLTTVSTMLAVFVTPLLTWFYVGRQVPVPVIDMLLSISRIVIIPVALGIFLNTWWRDAFRRYQRVFPLLSVLSIVVIISIIVGLNRDHLDDVGGVVGAGVAMHNVLGLAAGYWLPRWMGLEVRDCRALAIEVGMQNSGLGVALAVQHFSPLAGLPGALFSVWHNLSGSLLAGYWSGRDSTPGGARSGGAPDKKSLDSPERRNILNGR